MHCPSGENKGADQLHGYREADLRLCFRICICGSFGSLLVLYSGQGDGKCLSILIGHATLYSTILIIPVIYEKMCTESRKTYCSAHKITLLGTST